MEQKYEDKIENFIQINLLYVSRMHTEYDWFFLQDTIVIDTENLDKLIIPNGLHLEVYDVDDSSNRKWYFIVDDISGVYEELIDKIMFWMSYNETIKMLKGMDKVCYLLT